MDMWFLLICEKEGSSNYKPDKHKEILSIKKTDQSNDQKTDCKNFVGR